MSDLKTLGQTLDEYVSDIYTVESVYLYQDKDANPHVIVTQSNTEWDFTEVFSEHHDLKQEITDLKKQVESLQAKIRGLNRDKKSVESAIAKLVKHGVKS